MKFNFALYADTALTAVCAFIFVFTLVRYYTFNAAAALAAGIAAAISAGAGAYFYIRAKQRKKLLYGREAEEKRRLWLHLCLLPDEKACGLICSAAGGKVKAKRIECDDKIYFPVFKAEPCGMDDILYALRFDCGGKDKIIVCNTLNDNAQKLADCCAAKVLDCNGVYLMLKKADKLPEKYLYNEPEKVKLFKRIKTRFNRKLCLPAFWSGTALMVMSAFTFYPIYYIVTGALLLCVCAAAALFGQPKSI